MFFYDGSYDKFGHMGVQIGLILILEEGEWLLLEEGIFLYVSLFLL